jgi:hypothetical protein
VKSLGDGKFGGYLVLFGSPEKTDLVGDYFTAATDFGPNVKSRVYYDHGTDPTLKRLPVGEVELKVDVKGVWAEGVIKAREGYSAEVKEILGKDLPALIAGKKLGWSSGTAAHLVERKDGVKAGEITAWPLGLDASLTATPCEPRTLAVPLKSWVPSAAKGLHLGEKAEVGAAMNAVEHLHGRLAQKVWEHMGDEKSTPAARMRKIGAAYDECKSLAMKCMKSLMVPADGDGADDDDAGKKTLAAAADLTRISDNFLILEDRLRGLDLD